MDDFRGDMKEFKGTDRDFEGQFFELNCLTSFRNNFKIIFEILIVALRAVGLGSRNPAGLPPCGGSILTYGTNYFNNLSSRQKCCIYH